MISMVQRTSLNEESWNSLYDFLDPARASKHGADRDREAEARCLEITRKLVCFFASRGCPEAEDLAAETTLRVAGKCAALADSGHVDHTGYFYGVARNVLHEWQRGSRRDWTRRESVSRDPTFLPHPDTQAVNAEDIAHRCLELCMARLTHRARRLVLGYYDTEQTSRIGRHRNLAEEFGKSANALRIEVHRIRKVLRECVSGCVQPEGAGVGQ
jgi:RNA polymerase sigma factor (sigma-70 family)